jgi:hypothetical protein
VRKGLTGAKALWIASIKGRHALDSVLARVDNATCTADMYVCMHVNKHVVIWYSVSECMFVYVI